MPCPLSSVPWLMNVFIAFFFASLLLSPPLSSHHLPPPVVVVKLKTSDMVANQSACEHIPTVVQTLG